MPLLLWNAFQPRRVAVLGLRPLRVGAEEATSVSSNSLPSFSVREAGVFRFSTSSPPSLRLSAPQCLAGRPKHWYGALIEIAPHKPDLGVRGLRYPIPRLKDENLGQGTKGPRVPCVCPTLCSNKAATARPCCSKIQFKYSRHVLFLFSRAVFSA